MPEGNKMEINLKTLLENGIIDRDTISSAYIENKDGTLTRVWKGRSEDVSSLSEKYEFKDFVDIQENEFNKEKFSILVEEKGKHSDFYNWSRLER
jgi:hypothetical protein